MAGSETHTHTHTLIRTNSVHDAFVILVCVCTRVTYIHDAILVGVEEQPVVEERQLGIGGRHVGLQKHRG